MKKITCSKTLSVRIDGKGRFYLPDDLTLRNKKILSIIPVLEMYTFANDYEEVIVSDDAKNLYLNITSDGQTYFYENMSVYQISSDVVRGLYYQFNQPISFNNSYILSTTDNVAGDLILVVFYEDEAYSNATRNIDSNYSYCEIPLLYQNGLRNPLPDNRILVNKRFRNFIVSFPEQTPQGYQGVEQAEVYDYAYITLCKGSQIIIDKLPIKLLLQLGEYKMLQFDNIEFDFENSYIQIVGNNHSIENTYLYMIFEYER